jgi:pimeloyl-ACP methyl ester carboxylesterase
MMRSSGLHRRTLAHGVNAISYLEAGQGAGVIFLHSLGAEANLWRPQLTVFQRTNHVAAPDLRGHGNTVWGGRLPPTQMADDIPVLARHLGMKRVVLVGLSMGANVALITAAIQPPLVAGLVLASAFTESTPELRSVLLGVAEEAEKVIDMSEYAARRTARMLPRARGTARDVFASGAQKMSKAAMVMLSRALADWNVTPVLGVIKVPALVVVGGADPYVSVEMATRLAGQIKHSKLVVLPGAGHICSSDAVGRFNRALSQFLASLGWLSGRAPGGNQ